MKQHILPKQAKEITQEQFYDLFKNQHWNTVMRKDWADFHHKKATVGKMIEILDGLQLPYFDIRYNDTNPLVNFIKSRHVIIQTYSEDGFPAFEDFYNDELCDALWNAIKYVINMKR
jgi:hypothetical protein